MLCVSLFALVQGQSLSKEGEVCGTNMRGPSHQCEPHLECVNTHGPYIADVPGTCHPKCPTKRDPWGNCIPENCISWNDGCNTCSFKNNRLTGCSEKVCYELKHKSKCETYSTDKGKISSFLNCNNFYDKVSTMNSVCCSGEKNGNCVGSFPKTCSPECSSIVQLLFKDCGGFLEASGLSNSPAWAVFNDKCIKTNDRNLRHRLMGFPQ